MLRSVPTRLCGLILFVGLTIHAGAARAQEAGANAPAANAPRVRIPLPAMPAVFDRPTVQRLLDEIDKDRNDIVLWGGYFARNGTPDLPGKQGAGMLREALKAAEPASLRWLKLQYINTYYTSRYEKPADALLAYGATFDAAEALQTAGKPTLEQSQLIARLVEQYVNLLPIPWFTQSDPIQKGKLLAQSFRLWTRLPDEDSADGTVKSPRTVYEINWQQADAASGGAGFKEELRQAVAAHPLEEQTDVRLVLAYGEVLSESEPEPALKIMRRAEVLIPKDGKPQTENLALRIHKDLVDQLALVGNWDEAIERQHRFVREQGWGYVKLFDLLLRAKRQDQVPAVIAELNQSAKQESNAVSAARYLLGWARGSRYGDSVGWTREILESYLARPLPRALDFELNARALLVRALTMSGRDKDSAVNVKRIEQVEALLKFDETQLDPQSKSQRTAFQNLQAQRAGLDDWKSYVLGNPAPTVATANPDGNAAAAPPTQR